MRPIDANEVPFRIKKIVKQKGLIESEGYFIGHIKSLYVNLLNDQDLSITLQVRIGDTGQWVNLDSHNDGDIIDVSKYEMLRINVNNFNSALKGTVILFGYHEHNHKEDVVVKQTERDFHTSESTACLLQKILIEMKIMNAHLTEITGDERSDSDIN